jgi:hypothetical protein
MLDQRIDLDRLTGWYEKTQRPARVGFYQRERNNIVLYSYWNGETWGVGGPSLTLTSQWKNHTPACVQDAQWRGLKDGENI